MDFGEDSPRLDTGGRGVSGTGPDVKYIYIYDQKSFESE